MNVKIIQINKGNFRESSVCEILGFIITFICLQMAELFEKESFCQETVNAAIDHCESILSWAVKRSQGNNSKIFKLSDCKASFMTVNEMQLRAACCILARDGKLRWIEKARILTFEVIHSFCSTKAKENEVRIPKPIKQINTKRISTDRTDLYNDDKENENERQHKKARKLNKPDEVNSGCPTNDSLLRNALQEVQNFNKVVPHVEKKKDIVKPLEPVYQKPNEIVVVQDIKVHYESNEEKKAREVLHKSFDRSQMVYSNVMSFIGLHVEDEFVFDKLLGNIQGKYPDYTLQEVLDAMKTMEKFNKIMFFDDQNIVKL